jgi:hypothetical protein
MSCLAEAIQAEAGPTGWQKAEFTLSSYAPPTPQIALPKLNFYCA